MHDCRRRGSMATSVQSPLKMLFEAVASGWLVLPRQDDSTLQVGRSFSRIIVTKAVLRSNFSALVYIEAWAQAVGEDYTVLAKAYPTLSASAGNVIEGDERRLREAAFLGDLAGDLSEAKATVLYAVREPSKRPCSRAELPGRRRRHKPSVYAVSTEDRTIDPDSERMAERIGFETIAVKASLNACRVAPFAR